MNDKPDKRTAEQQRATKMYSARRRFKGLTLPAVVAVQVSAVLYTAFMVVAPLPAIIIASSALGWCVFALMLDDASVKIFNTKEYYRVLLNECTIQLEAAEKQGFSVGNISKDEGTNGDTDV